MLNFLKKIEIDYADKPKFEIEVYDNPDTIEMHGLNLNLKFKISNKNHQAIQLRQEIEIFPFVNSMDLKYEGDWKKLNLEAGVKLIEFGFIGYFFEKDSFDKNPEIEFKIKYFLKENYFEESVKIKLPTIKPIRRVENPFKEGKAGTGLRGNSPLFIGRNSLLSELSLNLLDFNSVPIYYIIFGLPRTGKSSILNQLADNPRWLKDKYITLFIGAEEAKNEKIFFYNLYNRTKTTLQEMGMHLKLPNEEAFKSLNAPAWQVYIEFLRLSEKIIKENNKRILILIDEYQSFAGWEGVPDSRNRYSSSKSQDELAMQFPDFFKVIRDQYAKTVVILLSGQEKLEDIAKYNPRWIQKLGGRITTKTITDLEKTEANELILKNFEKNGIPISQECLEHILFYTSGHPYLHVLLGYYIFERLLEGGQIRSNCKIEIADVVKAIEKIEEGDLKFWWADPWIIDDNAARVLLCAISELSYNQISDVDVNKKITMPMISINSIKDYLFNTYEFSYKSFDFSNAAQKLCNYSVIRKSAKGEAYQLLYPLLAFFIHNTNALGALISNIRKTKND